MRKADLENLKLMCRNCADSTIFSLLSQECTWIMGCISISESALGCMNNHDAYI